MFGPVRGRWKDGCRCGLRGWPPDGGAQRVFRERAAVECRAPAAEADVRHLRGGGCRVADRGLGPVCSWSRQGVGMSGVGRCAADRRCRVVGQQGGCRAGAGRWERRGPAGSSCSGGAGIGRCRFRTGRSHLRAERLFRRGPSVPAGGRHGAAAVSGRAGRIPVRSPCSGVDPLFRRGRHGAAAVSGRAGRIPRTQGLPSSRAAPSGRGPMLRFRTLFVLFCSVPPRRNRRRLQIRGFAAREKRKSCFFIFTL